MADYITNIKISDSSKAIGATYDVDGNKIKDKYQTKVFTPITINNSEQNTVEGAISGLNDYANAISAVLPKDDSGGLADVLSQAKFEEEVEDKVNDYLSSGDVEVSVKSTKEIKFFKDQTEFFISSATLKYKDIVKLVIIASGTDASGVIDFNGELEEENKILTASFFKPGARFEIYKKILICTDDVGNVKIYQSSEDLNHWASLSLKRDQKFDLMQYTEDIVEGSTNTDDTTGDDTTSEEE